ncbi:TetR/AcrR family transcriptional regulator [Altererythrobacter arenosus]|uniref:TetR/AcrR family transcriptional regulator n=1 Tax=Altererythrobacter arenosus TaxID=3032592 RepID=A0ABY8FRT2_9SPHN|nr:TetR/AcrR family transcriptional regulator [Altererythrobacter sp. CAU 1644]WFL77726.1 TetR/AcrR family transcriptional regulator [Altererythrobacter sp. CAU 1644]
MQAKKRFHHGNLKSALLDAALSILDASGPDAITIREVARRAGVSHAAPANHFADRRALLTEVSLLLFGQLASDIENKIEAERQSGMARIRSFADCLIEYGLEHPERYRMLWRRDLVSNEDQRLIRAMDGIYDRLIAEISSIGQPDNSDPHTLAIALWSLAHGYVSMRLDGNFDPATDDVTGEPRANAILDIFLAPYAT